MRACMRSRGTQKDCDARAEMLFCTFYTDALAVDDDTVSV